MATREWKPIKEYTDILFEQYKGIAKITINRPEVYNAFRPLTNHEMLDAFEICRGRDDIRVIILTGAATRRSALAAISTTRHRVDTATLTALLASTCSTCTR